MGEMNNCQKHGNGYGSCVACAIEWDIQNKRAYEGGLLEQIQSLTTNLAESEARVRELEEQLRDAVYSVRGRTNTVGDHDIYTPQISTKAVERWEAALTPGDTQKITMPTQTHGDNSEPGESRYRKALEFGVTLLHTHTNSDYDPGCTKCFSDKALAAPAPGLVEG